MCGIIGYAGKNKAVPYLLSGLERLEYRGYDSAGIAEFENGRINITKTAGRLSVLKSLVASKKRSCSTIGIGHTRWATHGEPSTVNSHPHPSSNGLFAVVHNGIIENFNELKKELTSDGFHFASETDTEVISNLLEKSYNGNLLETVSKAISVLKGSYALCILCRDFPDRIVAVRLGSPLVCGVGRDGVFLASDILALGDKADEIYRTDAGEIVVAKKDGPEFFSKELKKIKKSPEKYTPTCSSADKSSFEHYMLKEIYEQPAAVEDTLKAFVRNGEISFSGLEIKKEDVERLNSIYIVACGSAYHVGVLGKYALEALTGIPTHTDIASEFRYRNPPLSKNDLCIVISQSGETADSIEALRCAREKGSKIIGIVNVRESSIALMSDCVLYTRAGAEIAVATTKAYSAQAAVIFCLALHLALMKESISRAEYKRQLSALLRLPRLIERTIALSDERMKKLSRLIADKEHLYFIGRGTDYAIALEGSLKLKEVSYIHSEAYGAGELKHGTISLIERGTAVVSLMCDERVMSKTVSNAKEVKARHATVIALTQQKHSGIADDFDICITVPDCPALISPAVEVIPLQLLAYHTARERGCDIDKPRNLAKSVTVE